ncbi:hypothetical protein RI367_008114 [Sorochytrium milnesiophthora]
MLQRALPRLLLLVLAVLPLAHTQIVASPNCKPGPAKAMSSCSLALIAISNTRCLLLNTGDTQMQFFECQCDIFKKKYMCFNDPSCANDLGVQQAKKQAGDQATSACTTAHTKGSTIDMTLNNTYVADTSVLTDPGNSSNGTDSSNSTSAYSHLNDIPGTNSPSGKTDNSITSAEKSRRGAEHTYNCPNMKSLAALTTVLLLLAFGPRESSQIQASVNCPGSDVTTMSNCYLTMNTLLTTHCIALNSATSQRAFYECQCTVLKATYMCFNDPVCQNALDVQLQKINQKGQSDAMCNAARSLGSNITLDLNSSYVDTNTLVASVSPTGTSGGNSSTNLYNNLNPTPSGSTDNSIKASAGRNIPAAAMHGLLAILLSALARAASGQVQSSPLCPSQNSGPIDACLLKLNDLYNTRCSRFNTGMTQMLFFECQCDMLKKTYMCLNDPACQGATDLKTLKTQQEQQVNQTCGEAKRMGSTVTAQLNHSYVDTSELIALAPLGNGKDAGTLATPALKASAAPRLKPPFFF